jgi:hypothetical protein
LRATQFPVVTPDDWADPEKALLDLYRRAEVKAIEVVDWYLRDKRPRKLCSQGLRAVAVVLVAAGGVAPLLAAAGVGSVRPQLGYVLLALGAACVGFDRFFGLSSAWMRDVCQAQRVQRRLESFQYDWAEAVQVAIQEPESARARLRLLRSFTEEITELVQQETLTWEAEFRSNLAHLETQASSTGPETAHRQVTVRAAKDFE